MAESKKRGRGRPKKIRRPKKTTKVVENTDNQKYNSTKRRNSWLDIEEVTPLLKKRGIGSRYQYVKWHQEENIQWCPRYPHRVYVDNWPGWTDYLGLFNLNPEEKHRQRRAQDSLQGTYQTHQYFWSYQEARAHVRKWKVATKKAFQNKIHELGDQWPLGLPKGPDRVYGRTGEWINWKDFLGTDFNEKLKEIRTGNANDKIWVFLQHPKESGNVFWWRTILRSHLDQIKEKGFVIRRTFVYEDDLKSQVTQLLNHYCKLHEDEKDGHYVTNNIAAVQFELMSMLLIDQ